MGKAQQYLLPCKAAQMDSSYHMMVEKDELCIEEYSVGIILPARRSDNGGFDCGGVITKSGDYVVLSVIPGWLSGVYDDYVCQKDSRTAVYCGRMIGHWGHFLLETLSRLWFFLEHDAPSYVYVLVVNEDTKPPVTDNFKAFFKLLGIWDRIIFLNHSTQYKRVIVPERSFQYRRFFHRKYMSIFDRVISNADRTFKMSNPMKRIFLSRSAFPKAQQSEVGLSMLDDYFMRNGYQVLHPERMPLAEFILRMQAADCCAAESGTLAHNYLFCKNAQDTIVIERQTTVNDAQTSIARLRGLDTIYVDGYLSFAPVSQGAGPFWLHYTPCFKHFTEDAGMLPPQDSWLTADCIRANFAQYQQFWKQIYKDESPCPREPSRFADAFEEARNSSLHLLNSYGIDV